MSEALRLAILLSSRQVLTTEKGSPLDEAAAELRRLAAENEALLKDAEQYRWLPIESAPKDGTYFDGWCEGERFTDVRFASPVDAVNGEKDWCTLECDEGYLRYESVGKLSHWMPLPPAPKVHS